MFPISLPLFQGPLDLLLHLVERRQFDITEVSLVAVTEQYLDYLRRSDDIDPDALVEFIVVAARLLLIKSRRLLPSVEPPSPQPPAEDPAQELVERLLEYRRVREAAASLRELEGRDMRAYPRPAPSSPLAPPLEGVGLADLMRAFQEALARQTLSPELDVETIAPESLRIEDKITEIEMAVVAGPVSFFGLMAHCRTRREVIVSFLALLELWRLARVRVVQEQLFGEIWVFAVAAE